MRERADDQRQRLRKGFEGEFLAMDFFDAHKVSYFAIEQNTHTWSRPLAVNNRKRPDFIIWNGAGERRIVDVKNYTVHEVSASLEVEQVDVHSLKTNAGELGMSALLAFALERKFLFFVKLEDLTPPDIPGRCHKIGVEPGPNTVREEFRPTWVIPKAIVSWDAVAGVSVGLNASQDAKRLFT